MTAGHTPSKRCKISAEFDYICNEPAKRKRLGRSGTFMAQWFRRWTGIGDPGSIPARSVTLVAAVTRVRLWVEAPRLGWKWPEPGGSDLKKGGISVTNQPSVSDWVVQVPLWPSGLGVELWNRRPGIDTRTVRYTSTAIFRYIGVSTNQELWAWLQHYLFMLVPFLGRLLS